MVNYIKGRVGIQNLRKTAVKFLSLRWCEVFIMFDAVKFNIGCAAVNHAHKGNKAAKCRNILFVFLKVN